MADIQADIQEEAKKANEYSLSSRFCRELDRVIFPDASPCLTVIYKIMSCMLLFKSTHSQRGTEWFMQVV